jgi:hypothetical protein
MSVSSSGPRDASAEAMLSNDPADMMLPGIVVEMDADEAESLGAFEETALSEADAWDANTDLVSDEAGHGN